MSEEKKEGECCTPKGAGCCGPKKMIFMILLGILIFVSGMLFAKTQCPMSSGAMCPLSGKPMAQ